MNRQEVFAQLINVLLISIGNELVSGKTVNTNATFLAKNLTRLGFLVNKIITLPDSQDIVSKEISFALKGSDFRLILITGGLGPTWDDSTSKFLAKALNLQTELNEEALSIVKRRYLELFNQKLVDTSEMTPERKKMAILPMGAEPIDNPIGTAPGIFMFYKTHGTYIFCLPGVPREMEAMYYQIESKMVKLLLDQNLTYYEIEFTTNYTDESLLAPFLEKVRNKYDVWIKSMPTTYQEEKKLHLFISTTSNSNKNAKDEVLAAKEYLEKLIGYPVNKT